MSVPLERAVIVLLASGLSRRYGRRDKLMSRLGYRHLIDHSAGVLANMPALARVAVCPPDRHKVRDALEGPFIIALNKKPARGIGHSIAVGVQVALQFKPDAIVVCMGDMPFIEAWLVEALVARLGEADIVHAGPPGRMHPPTAFGAVCFDKLRDLDGDDGAKRIIGQGGFSVVGFNAPAPLLLDVDTRDELGFARRQLAVRERYSVELRAAPPAAQPQSAMASPTDADPAITWVRANARSS
jgi:molybdenum cofactor cytidylyltransferase